MLRNDCTLLSFLWIRSDRSEAGIGGAEKMIQNIRTANAASFSELAARLNLPELRRAYLGADDPGAVWKFIPRWQRERCTRILVGMKLTDVQIATLLGTTPQNVRTYRAHHQIPSQSGRGRQRVVHHSRRASSDASFTPDQTEDQADVEELVDAWLRVLGGRFDRDDPDRPFFRLGLGAQAEIAAAAAAFAQYHNGSL